MNILQAPLEDISHWLHDNMQKRIYEFHEGTQEDKNILGIKGAYLCELSKLGIRVPQGFIITSETCKDFFKGNKAMSEHLIDCLKSSIKSLENKTGKVFDYKKESSMNEIPLLLSVRSGAAIDMPSMMDSILNIGVNDDVIQRLIDITLNPRFGYDVQKRFLQMFGTIVLKVPKENYQIIIDEEKARDGISNELELSIEALQNIIQKFKKLVDIPTSPFIQLTMAIESIFCSWYSARAIKYRELHHISDHLGTAIVVQSMVYGNLNSNSCVGKLCTRNPDTGVNEIYGEYSICVEGDEISDGINERANNIHEMKNYLPNIYSELKRTAGVIETYFGDVQDIEFTVQSAELYILETIKARCSPQATVKIAIEMVSSGLLTERESILRVNASQMNYFLHPTLTHKEDITQSIIGIGLQTTIGSVCGKAVFTNQDAINQHEAGVSTILIRDQGSTEDIEGVESSDGVLFMHGGVTNAVVDLARTLDKTVITGAASCGMTVDIDNKCLYDSVGSVCIENGQEITLDGPTGYILRGNLVSVPSGIQSDFRTIMKWTDKYRQLPLYTYSSSWNELYRSLEFRSDGVGIYGIENFLADPVRIQSMQGYLFAESSDTKSSYLRLIEAYLVEEFQRIYSIMSGKRIAIRLFNASVNDYLPSINEETINNLSQILSMSPSTIAEKIKSLIEINPSFGIHGCRFALLHHEFLEMQIKAILASASFVEKTSNSVSVKILVPMLTSEHELEKIIKFIRETAEKFFSIIGNRVDYEIGAIIETPRACMCADKIAKINGVSFIIFSCDQITEYLFGLSKIDTKNMIKTYLKDGITHKDPFQRIDRNGVGSILSMAIKLIKKESNYLQIGVYGNQLTDYGTLDFFSKLGVDFMICTLDQLPITKVSLAQSYIHSTKISENYWIDSFEIPYWL